MSGEQRRAEIVDAAILLCGEKGLDATSMKDIADAVGITKASLYFHFASKSELIAAAHARCSAAGLDAGRRSLKEERTATGKLCRLFRNMLDMAIAHPEQARFEQLYTYSPTYCPYPPAAHRELYELVERIAREGQKRGELTNVDAHLLAIAYLGLEFQVHQELLTDPSLWNEETIEGCMRLIRGLVAPLKIPEDPNAI